MNEIVNKLQENEKLKIIFVSFVTFFLMIVAIMSNSIVSAFTITDGDNQFNYTYYFKATYEISGDYDTREDYFYWNDSIYLDTRSYKASTNKGFLSLLKNSSSYYNDGEYYSYSIFYKDGKEVTKSKLVVDKIFIDFGNDRQVIKKLQSNSSDLINQYKTSVTSGTFDPELKTPPTPTVTGEQVEGIVPAIIKVMKILVPVGLVVLAIFLGIYLVKRLMGLFL